jgi:hypothetical protein
MSGKAWLYSSLFGVILWSVIIGLYILIKGWLGHEEVSSLEAAAGMFFFGFVGSILLRLWQRRS